MPIELAPLDRSHLDACRALLGAACEHDRAAEVCEEKIFGTAPGELTRHPVGAFSGAVLIGVAVTSGDRLRLLAVHPVRRGRGIGTSLLAAAEAEVASHGKRRLRTGDQAGNYLAPGIDTRDGATLAWFERRGYGRVAENTNLLIDLTNNPRASRARYDELVTAAATRGYTIARAHPRELADVAQFVGDAFAPAWAFEVERAFHNDAPAVFLARRGEELVGFAAHDGNNRGLGWFGPAGTLLEHRGRGLGEALLLGCLVDVAAHGHRRCEVAWIGPRGFYEKAVGIAGERSFVVFEKELTSA